MQKDLSTNEKVSPPDELDYVHKRLACYKNRLAPVPNDVLIGRQHSRDTRQSKFSERKFILTLLHYFLQHSQSIRANSKLVVSQRKFSKPSRNLAKSKRQAIAKNRN